MKTLLIALMFGAAMPSFAIEFGEIRVVDGGRDPEGAQWIALEFELEKDWKTYWKYAGQNGLPPFFDFEGSNNLGSVEYFWPEPHLVGEDAIEAVGYKEDFTLPIRITPEDESAPVALQLHANIGVCRDICLPVSVEYSGLLDMKPSLTGMAIGRVAKAAFDDQTKCEGKPENAKALSLKPNGRVILADTPESDAETIYWATKEGICLD